MRWCVALFLGLGALAGSAEAACRQALALGLDVSGSVDAAEYRLQVEGLARAMLRPDVAAALTALPDAPLKLFVFEWSGPDSQRILLPWTVIPDHEALARASNRLLSVTRQPMRSETAIGRAMLFGADALAQHADCWRLTLDLSGDGDSNAGPRPRDVSDDARLTGITVNGLVIGADDAHYSDRRQSEIQALWAYYSTEVIRGPFAFVETATGFDSFEDAMAAKLLKETQGLIVSQMRPDGALPNQ